MTLSLTTESSTIHLSVFGYSASVSASLEFRRWHWEKFPTPRGGIAGLASLGPLEFCWETPPRKQPAWA